MATHSSILAWEIPWTEKPGGYRPWGCKNIRHNLATKQQWQHTLDSLSWFFPSEPCHLTPYKTNSLHCTLLNTHTPCTQKDALEAILIKSVGFFFPIQTFGKFFFPPRKVGWRAIISSQFVPGTNLFIFGIALNISFFLSFFIFLLQTFQRTLYRVGFFCALMAMDPEMMNWGRNMDLSTPIPADGPQTLCLMPVAFLSADTSVNSLKKAVLTMYFSSAVTTGRL